MLATVAFLITIIYLIVVININTNSNTNSTELYPVNNETVLESILTEIEDNLDPTY
jgi:hypothetical protein